MVWYPWTWKGKLTVCGIAWFANTLQIRQPMWDITLNPSIYKEVVLAALTAIKFARLETLFQCTSIEDTNNLYEIWTDLFLVLKDVIRSNMVKINSEYWGCGLCDFRTKYYATAVNHIEAKHVASDGFQCDLCSTISPTRQALKMHKSRKHR